MRRSSTVALGIRLTLVAWTSVSARASVAAASGPAEDVIVETLVPELDGGAGGLVVDAQGNICVAGFGDILGNPKTAGTRLFRVNPDGRAEVVVQEGLEGPVGIAIGEDGIQFVADCGANLILRIEKGKASTFAADPLLRCPNGIARDDSDNLYVSNFFNGDVLRVDGQGQVSKLATLPGNNNGHLTWFRGASPRSSLVFIVSLVVPKRKAPPECGQGYPRSQGDACDPQKDSALCGLRELRGESSPPQ